MTDAVVAQGGDNGFGKTCAASLQKLLGVRAGVEVVPPGTFPRTDFKARRVVDDRDLFRTLNANLEAGRNAG